MIANKVMGTKGSTKEFKALRKKGVFAGGARNRKDALAIGSYKQLRTQVLTELDGLGVRSVLVTGPTEGVGKTSVSINLAYAIAKLPNRQAILVDLDFRGSSMQSILGISSEYGSERIADTDFSIRKATYLFGEEKLLVLAASEHLVDSSEVLLSSNAADSFALFRNLTEQYCVIYDAPPVLGCDDVAALLPNMEAVIMVVEEGITSRRELSESMDMLGELPLVATVLNKSTDTSIRKYYY